MASIIKRAVDLSFFETARHRTTHEVEIGAPIAQVFSAFALEPETWFEWFPGFKEGGRYDTDPVTVGSTRFVSMGNHPLEEIVIALDDQRRWAWYMSKGDMPFKAFAEDYVFTDLGDRTRLTWTVAIDGNWMIGLGLKVGTGKMIRKAASNLTERLTTSH